MTAPGDAELRALLDIACEAARIAGETVMPLFRSGLAVELKADRTPVTLADRRAEEAIRAFLQRECPAHGILGEELGETPGDGRHRWILDPIDGTKSFIHGVPLYGTLIGVELEERSVVGVVVLPALGEIVWAAQGQGAWWQQRGWDHPRRAQVSTIDTLAEATMCTTSISEFVRSGRAGAYEQLRSSCGLARGWGDCYGYVLVATGRAEIMIEPRLNLWDMAALPPILSEAGGAFTDWEGRPTIYTGEGLGTNAVIQEKVLLATRGK